MADKPNSLEFFEAVYLDENLPLSYRLKAATEHAKYTHAQLRAVAFSQMDQHSFAAALERAIMRSKSPPPPAALAPPVQSREEAKQPFTMPRRNFR